MAFAQNENNQAPAREAKAVGVKAGVQGNSRRALGDIQNLVQPFNQRLHVDNRAGGLKKPGQSTAAELAAQQVAKGGVLTRRQAALAGVDLSKGLRQPGAAPKPPKREAAPLEPATAAPPPPALRSKAVGKSMSVLLEERSRAPANTPIRRSVSMVSAPSPLPDIDLLDKGNPLAVVEYIGDIFEYYRRVESTFRVSPDYMSRQTDITDKMRAILIDWLVEVHLKFKLMPETLHLAVNLVDRFLELKAVTRKHLQLVGITGLFIASKYEEIWAPELKHFEHISDKAYTTSQILAMEKVMLNSLKFSLTVPTMHAFQQRFLKAANVQQDQRVQWYSSYLLELALGEYSMLRYSYSLLAAACVHLALHVLDHSDSFPMPLERHCEYGELQLRPALEALIQLQAKRNGRSSLTAVFRKYSDSKRGKCATLPIPALPELPEDCE